MSDEEIKKLEKEVKKTKRLAGEAAMELHDLIEDRLPDAYGELMATAQKTYEACKAWDDATKQLQAATAETA
ncbi:CCE_0567 family metalloprotein [Methylomonas sp. MgM2]